MCRCALLLYIAAAVRINNNFLFSQPFEISLFCKGAPVATFRAPCSSFLSFFSKNTQKIKSDRQKCSPGIPFGILRVPFGFPLAPLGSKKSQLRSVCCWKRARPVRPGEHSPESAPESASTLAESAPPKLPWAPLLELRDEFFGPRGSF